MELAVSPEEYLLTYRALWRYIPEVSNICIHRIDNLKYHIVISTVYSRI